MTLRLLLSTCVALAACADAVPPRLVVRAGRLIDGSGGPIREHVRVDIDRGNIVAIGADSDEQLVGTAAVAVIDARAGTVMPGIIDAHAHILQGDPCVASSRPGIVAAARNLKGLLAAGVTTVADLGAPRATAVGLRRYVGTGRGRGPRLLVSGPLLHVATPEGGRAQVRDLAEGDVDFVGVAQREQAGAGVANESEDIAALCAVTDEAHTQKLRAFAYGASRGAYAAALECKIDAFAFAPDESLPSDLIARLVASHVPVAATLPVAHAAASLANALALANAGVRVGMGTGDGLCGDSPGSPAPQLEQLAASGMSPRAALTAATRGGAVALGLGDALGQLSPGYRADLIVVDGRPDEQIGAVRKIRAVVIDGIVQSSGAPLWWSTIVSALYVAWAKVAG